MRLLKPSRRPDQTSWNEKKIKNTKVIHGLIALSLSPEIILFSVYKSTNDNRPFWDYEYVYFRLHTQEIRMTHGSERHNFAEISTSYSFILGRISLTIEKAAFPANVWVCIMLLLNFGKEGRTCLTVRRRDMLNSVSSLLLNRVWIWKYLVTAIVVLFHVLIFLNSALG